MIRFQLESWINYLFCENVYGFEIYKLVGIVLQVEPVKP